MVRSDVFKKMVRRDMKFITGSHGEFSELHTVNDTEIWGVFSEAPAKENDEYGLIDQGFTFICENILENRSIFSVNRKMVVDGERYLVTSINYDHSSNGLVIRLSQQGA